MRGWYVYSDFMTKRAWACNKVGEVRTLENVPFAPSSYCETPSGELLVTCYIEKQGKVFKLESVDE